MAWNVLDIQGCLGNGHPGYQEQGGGGYELTNMVSSQQTSGSGLPLIGACHCSTHLEMGARNQRS